jgi:hypothetical protein
MHHRTIHHHVGDPSFATFTCADVAGAVVAFDLLALFGDALHVGLA